jgi:hypothetical protein
MRPAISNEPLQCLSVESANALAILCIMKSHIPGANARSAFECLATALRNPPAWWQPHLTIAHRVLEHDSGSIADALNAAKREDAPVDFVRQSALPEGEAYEAHIARTRCVPTRDNLHDLLNGLMWLRFPLTKLRMNLLQADQIATRGIAGARGPIRDALTVFDENAAVLRASPGLVEALHTRAWSRAFLDMRSQWRSAEIMLFGHALLEKLMQPRKAITAHVWLAEDLSDRALSTSLSFERLATKPFFPLPVLGIPGWWPDNDEPTFYEDAAVFRSHQARSRSQ